MSKKLPISSDISTEIYKDVIQPSAKEIGETLALIPRAIKAAFSPIDILLFKRECNVSAIKELIIKKAKNISPNNIVSPEPYIAVPAMEAITYCMDNELLRSLYANLLTNAINKECKDSIHPAFVSIISQLAPLDALVMSSLFSIDKQCIPVSRLYIQKVPNLHLTGQRFEQIHFSDYILDTPLHESNTLDPSIDNLTRLGLISMDFNFTLSPNSLYDYVKQSIFYNSDTVQDKLKETVQNAVLKLCIETGKLSLTEFGLSFFKICITDPS